eukprot:596121-Rhodomonas_salina.1
MLSQRAVYAATRVVAPYSEVALLQWKLLSATAKLTEKEQVCAYGTATGSVHTGIAYGAMLSGSGMRQLTDELLEKRKQVCVVRYRWRAVCVTAARYRMRSCGHDAHARAMRAADTRWCRRRNCKKW